MKFKGEISLLTVALIWGSGFVATDLALGNLTATQVMAVRFVIAAIFIGVLFGHRTRLAFDSLTIRRGIFLGIFLNLSFLAQTVGLVFTTPSKNAFLTAVNVILVPFIAAIFARGSHKVERSGVIGALLAVVGIGLISLNLDGTVNLGDLLSSQPSRCFQSLKLIQRAFKLPGATGVPKCLRQPLGIVRSFSRSFSELLPAFLALVADILDGLAQ